MLYLFIAIFGLYGGGALACEAYGRLLADGRESEPYSNYFYAHPTVIIYTVVLCSLLLAALTSLAGMIKGKELRYSAFGLIFLLALAAQSMLIYKKRVGAVAEQEVLI